MKLVEEFVVVDIVDVEGVVEDVDEVLGMVWAGIPGTPGRV